MIPLTLDEIATAMLARTEQPLTPVTVRGVSTDSRTCQPGDLFFAVRGDRHDGHEFVGAAVERGAIAVVADRRIPPTTRPVLCVDQAVSALGRLAAYHRTQSATCTIAVTGSNGKTTTKCMIEQVLSRHLRGRAAHESYNNFIGVPLTLLSTQPGDDFLVVEIGSNAHGEVAALAQMASPNIAVVTSIGRAHLEGFGRVEGVAAEKLSILNHVRPGGLCVLNADGPDLAFPASQRSDLTFISFGRRDTADIRVSDVVSDLDSVSFVINGKYRARLPVPGGHNALNAAATFAACRRLKIEPEQIVAALADFVPPPMRLNVTRIGSLTLIDDSYNANPDSARAAIDVLKSTNGGRRVFVAGDMLELGAEVEAFHQDVGRNLGEAGIDVVVGVGAHAGALLSGVLAANSGTSTILYSDAEAACGDLPGRLQERDTVLIKGSRRVGLDRLARRLREVFS